MTVDTVQETLSAYISTEEIKITGLNPRKDFDEEGLENLANSIHQIGVLEPLVVREGPEGTELIAGERRLRAAKMAGLKKVPVVVKDLNDEQAREIMLMENLQRKDLRPLEEANALTALIEMGLSREELADRISMSASWVSGRIRLLKLPKEILKYLEEGKLGVEHAMAFVPYVEWPVINVLVKNLQSEFASQYRGEVTDMSKHDIRHLIDLELRNGKQTLDIDSFGYMMDNREEKKKLFHKLKPKCKGCKATIEHGGTKRLCLDAKCFRKKMRQVNKELKVKQKKKVDKITKGGKVDLDKAGWNTYEELTKKGHRGARFNLQTCNKCKDRKTGVHADGKESTVCMRPSCFHEKNNEVREAQEAESRRKVEVVRWNLESFLDEQPGILVHHPEDERGKRITSISVDVRAIRFAMLHITTDDDVYKVALKDYAKKKPKKGWKSVMAKVPDKDLARVFLSMLIVRDTEIGAWRLDDFDWSGMENHFPELLEGELPPKEEELAEGTQMGTNVGDQQGTDDSSQQSEPSADGDLDECIEHSGELCDDGKYVICDDCEVHKAIKD